jgi:hypothetical protein
MWTIFQVTRELLGREAVSQTEVVSQTAVREVAS